MQIQNYKQHAIEFSVLCPPNLDEEKAANELKTALFDFKNKIEKNGLGMIILPNFNQGKDSNKSNKPSSPRTNDSDSDTETTNIKDVFKNKNNNALKTLKQMGDTDISEVIKFFYTESTEHNKKKRARKQQTFCVGKKEQKLNSIKEDELGEGRNLIPKAISQSNL